MQHRSIASARSLLVLPALFALSSTLGACAVAAGDDSSVQDTSAIVGGTKVTSSDPLTKVTVAIVDATVGEYCTGVVLDRTHVVTASHCFDDTTRTPSIRIGAGDTGKLLPVRSVAVNAMSNKADRDAYDALIVNATHASTIATPSAPLYDVAVLELTAPLPSTVTPATFAAAATNLGTSTLGTAGYGCTTTACKSALDILHKVAMQFVRTAPTANVVVLQSGGRKGSCAGDSGGPDYIVTPAGGVQIFGLVMTGPAACEAGISVDTLVAPYLSWMHSTAQTMGGGVSTSTYTLTVY